MASEYARIADRQLAYAHVQLDLARASEKRFSRTACLNAGCLHLTEALLAYLHELQLSSCGALQNGSSLQVIFSELSQSSEVTDFRVSEMITLASNRQSWMDNLIKLQRYFRKPAMPEQKLPEQKQQTVEARPARDTLIASSANLPGRNLSIDVETIEPSIELVEDILAGMKNLVVRHREFSAEY